MFAVGRWELWEGEVVDLWGFLSLKIAYSAVMEIQKCSLSA
jgi:hypothetical protein